MLPALDLAGVVRITRLITHTHDHLPSWQGVHVKGATEPPQRSENSYAAVVEAVSKKKTIAGERGDDHRRCGSSSRKKSAGVLGIVTLGSKRRV